MYYIYIKNWKIMWSSTSDKLNLWKPFAVELPWYYRLIDWIPKMTINECDIDPSIDYFVWNRDWKEYWRRRIEATWWEKPEDTRVHDELKEEKKEESETEEENDENPMPENHSESEE